MNRNILLFSFLIVGTGFFLSSCNKDELDVLKSDEILTRSAYIEADIQITEDGQAIRFKDQETYENILQEFTAKSVSERIKTLNDLAFKSQYVLLAESDKELAMICENSDEESFPVKYKQFRDKYDGLFMFNTIDEEDLSAYTKLINSEWEYFANEKGEFYIGDSLVVAPMFNNFNERAKLISLRDQSNMNLSLNHAWSHQSKRKVGLYISLNSEKVYINLTAQIKNMFGWVRYDTEYHAIFKLNGGFEFYETAYFGYPYEKYVNKDNIEFRIDTRELSGNVTIYLGRVKYKHGPLVYHYGTSGYMKVWSRGVAYEKRGESGVELHSN